MELGTVAAETLQAARAILTDAITAGDFPGAVALVRSRGQVILHEAVGAAWLEPVHRPMLRNMVFDLASLTKPLATTAVVLSLVERGLLDLDAPVGRYLPELRDRDELTVRRLLTHTSGLPAWYPTYVSARTPAGVLRTIAALPLSHESGTQVEYSCLGFIVLGLATERASGEPLDRLAEETVFRRLGLTEIGYRPRLSPDRFAATERGNDYEKVSTANAGVEFDDWRIDYIPG